MKKGEKMSDELKEKLSKAKKGKVFTPEHRANLSKAHLGKIPTNLESFRYNRKGSSLTAEHRRKIGLAHKGKTLSPAIRRKIGLAGKGRQAWNKGLKGFMAKENNPNWIADRSLIKKYNRQTGTAHGEWVEACKQRDGRKCRLGGKDCCGQLEVHHIYRFSEYPDLRYSLENGITLCHYHHPRKKHLEEELRETFSKLVSQLN